MQVSEEHYLRYRQAAHWTVQPVVNLSVMWLDAKLPPATHQ